MHYNRSDLVDFFMPYTPSETVYKRYFELKHNPGQLEAYRASLSGELQELLNSLIYQDQLISCDMDENYPYFIDTNQNLRVEKHERYSIDTQHHHAFFELIYVLKGQCRNTIKDRSIWMQEDDICLISPGAVHAMRVFDDSIIINILIRKSVFKETFFKIPANDNVLSEYFSEIFYTKNANHYLIFHTQGDDLLHNVLESLIWEEYRNRFDKYSDEIKEGLLSAIFSYLIRNHSREMEASKALYSENPRIMEVLQYLRENYRTATLKSTAAYFYYTQQHLSRLVRTETGLRFMEILTDIRMQKACDLLKNTTLRVLEVSSAVGYENTEHFYRAFRRKTGLTPREYRKQNGRPAVVGAVRENPGEGC